MAKALKAKNAAHNGTKRREPAPVDYSDEISDKVLAEIQSLALSRDAADQKWETVRDPAW